MNLFGDDNTIDQNFESFYELYPRHKAKEDARKAWRQLRPSASLIEKIMRDIRMRKKLEWLCKQQSFIPLAGTYLRGRRWTDEIEEGKPDGTGTRFTSEHGGYSGFVRGRRPDTPGSSEGSKAD